MSSNKETPIKTIGFVFLVCLVCAALVSIAASGLKPLQTANKLLDKQTKILEASGLLDKAGTTSKDIVATYNKYVVAKMIDLDSGAFIEGDVDMFDERAASRDVTNSHKLENDTAGINRRADNAVIYLVQDEAGKLQTIVLPIVGSGLWDLMYGFVGLETDLSTVRSLIYSDHKETPGLGALITNDKWKSYWPGKKIFNDDNELKINVVKGGAKPGDIHGVDALSGATLTSNGVKNSLHFWFGEQGYGPFITKFREGGLK
jgi:Na+-transporting NADH:ubiquinone oxidoreductase subunit C